MMSPRHSLERAAAKQSVNIRPSLSPDGIVHPNCFSSYDDTRQLLTCGELGKSLAASSDARIPDLCRCVFGEMFKGKPILSGSTDLDQAQLIFSLVGTPTEENMPGWSSLPGCDGVKNFRFKRGNLAEAFKE